MGERGTSTSGDGETRGSTDAPSQVMPHRKVLQIAGTHPDESTERIADRVGEVSGAFVEQVFAEYGDPGDGDRATDSAGGSELRRDGGGTNHETNGQEHPVTSSTEIDLSELNDRQLATIRAVSEDPTATQQEIADRLGVSRATVSKRLCDVPGFEWQTRRQLVGGLSEVTGEQSVSDQSTESGGASGVRTDGAGTATEDGRTDTESTTDPGPTASDSPVEAGLASDPELVHKVAHACLDAEYISTEEELRVLRRLLAGQG